MMNEKQFDELINIFEIDKKMSFTDEKKLLWYRSVKNLDYNKVKYNIRKFIETSNQFPNLCDLRSGLNAGDEWIDQWKEVMNGSYADWNKTTKEVCNMLAIDTDTPNMYKAGKIRDFEKLYKTLVKHGDRNFDTKDESRQVQQVEETEEHIDLWTDKEC